MYKMYIRKPRQSDKNAFHTAAFLPIMRISYLMFFTVYNNERLLSITNKKFFI